MSLGGCLYNTHRKNITYFWCLSTLCLLNGTGAFYWPHDYYDYDLDLGYNRPTYADYNENDWIGPIPEDYSEVNEKPIQRKEFDPNSFRLKRINDGRVILVLVLLITIWVNIYRFLANKGLFVLQLFI